MKASELLKETKEFYSVPGKRATKNIDGIGGEYCVYKTEDGRMCAVSRIANEDFDFSHNGGIGDYSHRHQDWRQHLKEEYRDITLSALQTVQGFHDTSSFWNVDGGLTGDGERRYAYLFNTIDNLVD